MQRPKPVAWLSRPFAWSARGLIGALGVTLLSVSTAGAAIEPEPSAPTPVVAPMPGDATTNQRPVDAPALGPGAPINPGPYKLKQPDGTSFSVTAWGDSQTYGYETTKGGYAIAKDADGVWRYATTLSATGQALPGSLIVGKDAAPAEAQGLRGQAGALARTHRVEKRSAPGTAKGVQPAVVLLVQFADQPSLGSTEQMWSDSYFGAGNSVNTYYNQASFGQFQLSPAPESSGIVNNGVIGWLTLPGSHPNFGSDFGLSEVKLHRDAVKAASPYLNFRSFDTNRNGKLSTSELHVTIIVAGYETSTGGDWDTCGNSVWGHQGGMGGYAPRIDGVIVDEDGGTMFGEWHCASFVYPGHMATLGIMVHETGHDLGWPDLYDVDYSSRGLGPYSIMAGGSWMTTDENYAGMTPSAPDAWSKYYQGWITPTPVVGGVTADIPAAETSPTAYLLGENPNGVDWSFYKHRGKGEYFLVENRQQIGYDAALPACGLAIWHIDESVVDNNDANSNDAHRLVDLVEANGLNPLDDDSYRGDASDLWPGSLGRLDFNDLTAPSANYYGGRPSKVALHANAGCGATMSTSMAVPMANDTFKKSVRMRDTSGSLTGANGGSTKEYGEPLVGGNWGGSSIWYKFKAPADGDLAVSTLGSGFDTILGVFKGRSVSKLKEVAFNDNASATDPTSYLVAKVKRGKTYHVVVDGSNYGAGPATGASVMNWSYHPGNDSFVNATKIKGKKGKRKSSNAGATREVGEDRKIARKKSGHTVWYKLRAKKKGRIVFDLSGSRFNTLLGVYTGKSVDRLHKVKSNDNGGKKKTSRLRFKAKKGKTYYICVAGAKRADGKFILRWH